MPTEDDYNPSFKEDNDRMKGIRPVQLVPGKSDHEIAKELKEEMLQASIASCAVMDKAVSLGFQLATTFGLDQVTKKFKVVHLVVSKTFE